MEGKISTEGEPRFEYKFIRRAVPESDNIIVTSLIRG
jgi:hypothetical protein